MELIDLGEIKKEARRSKVKLKHVAAKIGISPQQLSGNISGDQNTGWKTINRILVAIKELREGK
jgi:transcriptional regulator with XRE-family HTH domain